MAESLHPLLRAGAGGSYLSPQVVNLLRFMVGEQGNANVGYDSTLEPGVYGNFNSSTDRVNLKPKLGPEITIETLAHELSHATESQRLKDDRVRSKTEPYYPMGSIGSDYLNEFFMDMMPNMSKQDQEKYQRRMIDRAREVGLPSADRGNFNEIEANSVAARTMNELGMATADSKQVDKFMEEFPEFKEWVNSDLAGKYRNSPRMTELITPPSMADRIVQLFK